MRLQVTATETHQGKALDIDCDRETITLVGLKGEQIGTVSWTSVINFIEQSDEQEAATRHARVHPRAPLALKIFYTTPEGKQFESITAGIGGGGLFIESSVPLPIGSELTVEFTLPDRPLRRLKAKGKVAWIRHKPERYLLFPGMGVQFVDIQDDTRQQVMELVTALNQNRVGP
jgi:type IV pilus assembly protein PilZ